MSDSQVQHKVALAGSERQAPPTQAEVIGLLNPDEPIEVSIILHPREHIDEYEIGDRALAGLPHLSREEVVAKWGASPRDMEKVKSFARAQGLVVDEEKTSAEKRMVVVKGTAQTIADAFGVRLHRYIHRGISFRGRIGPLYIPRELNGIIAGVLGIDDRPQLHTSAVRAMVTSHTVLQIGRLYEFPTIENGAGQCIGIIELGGGYRVSDLQTYFDALRIPQPTIVTVAVDGVGNNPGVDDGADEEVALDIEVAGAIAPGATIAVYFAPNTEAGFLDAILTAINDTTHAPSVISISWGQYEGGWTAQAITNLNQAFQQAALLGITICCAAGDSGAQDNGVDALNIDFPSSSPYALACGGTRLMSARGVITQERVWNDGFQSATGGGVSTIFPKPSWQNLVHIPLIYGWSGRGIPDVAGVADPQTGYEIFVNGQTATIGGTSAVAPLWAGLLALFNQALGRRVGYINPVLYQRIDHAKTFHDIIVGGNNGYVATPGWDLCTGWGTPRGIPLLNALRIVLH